MGSRKKGRKEERKDWEENFSLCQDLNSSVIIIRPIIVLSEILCDLHSTVWNIVYNEGKILSFCFHRDEGAHMQAALLAWTDQTNRKNLGRSCKAVQLQGPLPRWVHWLCVLIFGRQAFRHKRLLVYRKINDQEQEQPLAWLALMHADNESSRRLQPRIFHIATVI